MPRSFCDELFSAVPPPRGWCLCQIDKLSLRAGSHDDVRTLHRKRAAWAQEVWHELQTKDGQRILHNIKLLRERIEPEVPAKEEPFRSRQVKAAKLIYRARGDDGHFCRLFRSDFLSRYFLVDATKVFETFG